MGNFSEFCATVATWFDTNEKRAVIIWALCAFSVISMFIAGMMAFSNMQMLRDELYEEGNSSVAKLFTQMQFGIFSMAISVALWVACTMWEYAYKNTPQKALGITIVLGATFYTMIMLLSHGISLAYTQTYTADWVLETYNECTLTQENNYPNLCAFDEGDKEKYEATYAFAFMSFGCMFLYGAVLGYLRYKENKEGISGGGDAYKAEDPPAATNDPESGSSGAWDGDGGSTPRSGPASPVQSGSGAYDNSPEAATDDANNPWA